MLGLVFRKFGEQSQVFYQILQNLSENVPKYLLVKHFFLLKTGKSLMARQNEPLRMPNAQVLTPISTFYQEVTPSGKSLVVYYSVSSIQYHQRMKTFPVL